MKTMWRCLNPKCADTDLRPGHEFVFEGDPNDVKCPKCGITLKHPANIARYLHSLVPVHYLPPDPIIETEPGLEMACQPGKPRSGMQTAEPQAVTCPMCLETEAYKAAKSKQTSFAVIPEGDRKLTMTAAGITKAEAVTTERNAGPVPVAKPDPCNC